MAKQVYQQILIVSIVAFVPVVLASGLAAGYIAGIFLRDQFHLPWFVFLICVVLGVASSFYEVVRLIRLAIKTEKRKDL